MSAQFTILYGGHSDIGLVRKENQDAYGAFPEGDIPPDRQRAYLFLVADGMGGHRGGGEASGLALEVIRDSFLNSPDDPLPNRLQKAFRLANEAIYQHSCQIFPPAVMGSTCTALAISNDSACIAHVGDSRAYRISRSDIRQMTKDHSVVGEMLRRGQIPKEAAALHPERSLITRALGVKPEVKVDIIEGISPGESDAFLLCTDGLSNAVSEAEMQTIILSHQAQDACKALVDLAVSRGGEDNVTAQVVHVQRSVSLGDRLQGLLRRGAS
ncbi:Stp1/IreP family PP2C-type Ser/Thr phosphatase [bacterium]|nr:MAG: Stp1/IreP family PP2C-type Ser/Thr phosphatase [bacterium]